jgi:hypothetical protein
MQSKYLFHENTGNIYCLASGLDENKVSNLAQFFHNYHNGVIMLGLFGQSYDEIHRYGLPFPLKNW